MSAAQKEVTESLLSAVSGFKAGLLARDAGGGKTTEDVEKLYNGDVRDVDIEVGVNVELS